MLLGKYLKVDYSSDKCKNIDWFPKIKVKRLVTLLTYWMSSSTVKCSLSRYVV